MLRTIKRHIIFVIGTWICSYRTVLSFIFVRFTVVIDHLLPQVFPFEGLFTSLSCLKSLKMDIKSRVNPSSPLYEELLWRLVQKTRWMIQVSSITTTFLALLSLFFPPYSSIFLSFSSTCYTSFPLPALLSSSQPAPPLDTGVRWSSNGVYREPAFTTSEANRQVSLALGPTEGRSLSPFPPFPPLFSTPPSPFLTASSAGSARRSVVCPGEPCQRGPEFPSCLPLMCADVQQAPFFCRGNWFRWR